jgi:hypothetical protein
MLVKECDIKESISVLKLYNNMELELALASGEDFDKCVTLIFRDESGEESFIYGAQYPNQYEGFLKKDENYYRFLFRKILDEAFLEGERDFGSCSHYYGVRLIVKDNDLCLYEKMGYNTGKKMVFMCEGMNNTIKEWYTDRLPSKPERRKKIIKKLLEE